MTKRTRKPSSPAQQRQQHLRMRKGQIASMCSVLMAIKLDPRMTAMQRGQASLAHDEVRAMYDRFNEEVGW